MQHEIKRFTLHEMMPSASLYEISRFLKSTCRRQACGTFHAGRISFAKGEFHLPASRVNFIVIRYANYLPASSMATATATVIPTMGLLPAPMRPIIST